MRAVAVSSEKSVFSVSRAFVTASCFNDNAALAWRIVRARLMPLMAPSRNCKAAVPARLERSAPRLAPLVVTSALTRPLPSSKSLPATSLSSALTLTPLAASLTAMRWLRASALPLPSMLPPQARPARRAMRRLPLSSVASILASAILYWRKASALALKLNWPLTARRPSSFTGESAGAAAVGAGLSGPSSLFTSRLSKRAVALMVGTAAPKAALPVLSKRLLFRAPLSVHCAPLASAPALPRRAICSGCRLGSASVAAMSRRSKATARWPMRRSKSALSVPSSLRGPLLPASVSTTPGRRRASKLPLGAAERRLPARAVGPLSL